MIPPALLIHTCTITHQEPTGEVDAYGVPGVTTTTQTGVVCRFTNPGSMTRRLDLDSGSVFQTLPGVLFPAGTAVAERDTVSAGPAGFDKTYSVKAVKAIYGPTAISHLKAELEAVG
ncbi:hypothetical protein [Methanoculleus sp.]|uniref:hypothetical protein n=1 Tax=Methanoculleus sp. TaxID=90427 RepID=UPI00272DEB2E|nr:hypothetical protein [Methanoculleus sp.]